MRYAVAVMYEGTGRTKWVGRNSTDDILLPAMMPDVDAASPP